MKAVNVAQRQHLLVRWCKKFCRKPMVLRASVLGHFGVWAQKFCPKMYQTPET
jgi:hypothetical protein